MPKTIKTQSVENHHYFATCHSQWGKFRTRAEAEKFLARYAKLDNRNFTSEVRDSLGLFGFHMLLRIALPLDAKYDIYRENIPAFEKGAKPHESWDDRGIVEVLSIGGFNSYEQPKGRSENYFAKKWGGRFVLNNPKPATAKE